MKGLEQMRKSKNKSQIELARALNVSNITISRWESGKQSPDIETVKKIVEYFDCSIDDIINPPQHLIELFNSNACWYFIIPEVLTIKIPMVLFRVEGGDDIGF